MKLIVSEKEKKATHQIRTNSTNHDGMKPSQVFPLQEEPRPTLDGITRERPISPNHKKNGKPVEECRCIIPATFPSTSSTDWYINWTRGSLHHPVARLAPTRHSRDFSDNVFKTGTNHHNTGKPKKLTPCFTVSFNRFIASCARRSHSSWAAYFLRTSWFHLRWTFRFPDNHQPRRRFVFLFFGWFKLNFTIFFFYRWWWWWWLFRKLLFWRWRRRRGKS